MKQQNSAKIVFNILGAQYKSLEEKMFMQLKEEGREDLVKRYKGMTYARKIYVLDKMAGGLDYEF